MVWGPKGEQNKESQSLCEGYILVKERSKKQGTCYNHPDKKRQQVEPRWWQ